MVNLVLTDPEHQNIEGVLRGAVGHFSMAGAAALGKQAQEALDTFRASRAPRKPEGGAALKLLSEVVRSSSGQEALDNLLYRGIGTDTNDGRSWLAAAQFVQAAESGRTIPKDGDQSAAVEQSAPSIWYSPYLNDVCTTDPGPFNETYLRYAPAAPAGDSPGPTGWRHAINSLREQDDQEAPVSPERKAGWHAALDAATESLSELEVGDNDRDDLPHPDTGDTATAVGNLLFAVSAWKATDSATAAPAWRALVAACQQLVSADLASTTHEGAGNA